MLFDDNDSTPQKRNEINFSNIDSTEGTKLAET